MAVCLPQKLCKKRRINMEQSLYKGLITALATGRQTEKHSSQSRNPTLQQEAAEKLDELLTTAAATIRS